MITLLLFLAPILSYPCYLLLKERKIQKNKLLVKGKNVLIIGASSGIGRSLAKLYAHLGACLFLVARREALLEEVREECRSIPGCGEVTTCVGDITKIEDCEKVLGSLSNGDLDILVICAGTLSTRLFCDYSNEELPRMIDGVFQANLVGPILLLRRLWETILKSKTHVVVISSAAGQIAAPTRSLYSASKAALDSFIEAVSLESRGSGVRWSVVCPGSVDTGLREKAMDRRSGDSSQIVGKKSVVDGRMTGDECAQQMLEQILQQRQGFVYVPWYYRQLVWLKWFCNTVVERMLLAKYKFAMSNGQSQRE